MFSQLRLAAFDMDGTLLNANSQMAEITKEACRKLQATGCKLILSTGRTYASALLPIDNFPFDGYVCSNGATIHEADGTLVKSISLPAEMVVDMVHKIRQEPIYYELHDTASNRWMVKEDRERIERLLSEDTSVEGLSLRRFSFYKWARVAELQELLSQVKSGATSVVKIFVWHREPERLNWVREQFGPWTEAATVTSSGMHNVEVIPKGVSKWDGLRYFCSKWGYTPEQVMAFGDADNDREMLTHAGFSVAMDNAEPEIKRLARFVTDDHDHDGVARFILEQVLPRA
jgi:Cof subfamily protein (haloacid dehalogenase superfamily)